LSIATHGCNVLTFFINDRHPVEVVLRKVEVLNWFILHWLVMIIIFW
jgi:hypothetical protein